MSQSPLSQKSHPLKKQQPGFLDIADLVLSDYSAPPIELHNEQNLQFEVESPHPFYTSLSHPVHEQQALHNHLYPSQRAHEGIDIQQDEQEYRIMNARPHSGQGHVERDDEWFGGLDNSKVMGNQIDYESSSGHYFSEQLSGANNHTQKMHPQSEPNRSPQIVPEIIAELQTKRVRRRGKQSMQAYPQMRDETLMIKKVSNISEVQDYSTNPSPTTTKTKQPKTDLGQSTMSLIQIRCRTETANSDFMNETRKMKIERYQRKKQLRNWGKKISYECRKRVADSRLRIKGRFVTLQEASKILGEDVQEMDLQEVRARLQAKLNLTN